MPATWNELRDHLRATYKIALDEDVRLGLTWQFPDGEGTQRQYVRSMEAFGVTHVQILANVVPVNAMKAHDAMVHNATLAVGALQIVDDYYVLAEVLPLVGVDLAVIDRALVNVAHEAMRLRMKQAPGIATAAYYDE